MGRLGVKLLFVFVLVQMCSANGGPDCGSATVVGALPYHDQAILDVMGGPSCAGEPSNDVFYSFTAPATDTYVFSMSGSTNSKSYLMRLWTDGTCCTGSSVIASGFTLDANPRHQLTLSAGQSVVVEIGISGVESVLPVHYRFQLFALQTNADICPGVDVVELPFSFFQGAGSYGNEINVCNLPSSGPDAFFRVQFPFTRTCRISTCLGGTDDTVIELVQSVDGTCFNSFHLACADNECGVETSLTYTFLANTVYYIALDNRQPTANLIYLAIDEQRDTLPGYEIERLPFYTTNSTSFADNSLDVCNFGGNNDHVYRFTPDTTVYCQISLCTPNNSFNTTLGIFQELSPNNFTALACNDDYCGQQSQLNFTFQAGTTYYVVVDGAGLSSGFYELSVTEQQIDPCTNAINVTFYQGYDLSYPGTTIGAENTVVGCSTSIGGEVFYSVQIMNAGLVGVRVTSANFDPVVNVYTGTCGNLVVQLSPYGGVCQTSDFAIVSGPGTYFIVVDDTAGMGGTFDLRLASVSQPPGFPIQELPFEINVGVTSSVAQSPLCGTTVGNQLLYFEFSAAAGDYQLSLGETQSIIAQTTQRGDQTRCAGASCSNDIILCSPTSDVIRIVLGSVNFGTSLFHMNFDHSQYHCPTLAIPSLPFTTALELVGPGSRLSCGIGFGRDSTFLFQPDATVICEVSFQHTIYDPVLSIETETGACAEITEIACNDNYQGLNSQLVFEFLGGQPYFITADQTSYWSSVPGTLSVIPCFASDLVADSLTVRSSGNDVVLNWTEANCAPLQYNIHRTTQPDIAPSPTNLIATTLATSYTDTNVVALPSDRHFYLVTTSLID